MRNNTAIFSSAIFTTALLGYTNFMTNQRVNVTSCIFVLSGGINYIIISYNFTT